MATQKESNPLYKSVQLENPSNCIRLLQIRGSIADAFAKQIECTLTSFTLSDAPPYRCLSYVWGVENQNSDILVNSEFTISVTKNLQGFLERIRAGSKNPDGYIWIDAICINQNNKPEKEIQVAIMGAIYAQATQVIAWLGWEWDKLGDASDNGANEDAETRYADIKPPGPLVPEGGRNNTAAGTKTEDADKAGTHATDNEVPDQKSNDAKKATPVPGGSSSEKKEDPAEAAIDFIRVLYPAFKNWMDQGNSPWTAEFSSHAFGASEMYDMLGIQRIGIKRWAALAHFLNRQWFQRTWIVQEAALAKELLVVCGFQVLLWDQIVKTCIFLQASGWFSQLMELIDPNGIAVGPGYRGIVFASMQSICRLEPVEPELGGLLPSPFAGLQGPSKYLEYDLLLFCINTSRPFEAGDKRDKVYAPLALLKQMRTKFAVKTAGGLQLQLEADYQEKKKVEDVYMEAAALIIQHTETLLLLSYVDVRTPNSTQGLPSWVPDFSQRAHASLLDIPGVTYDALRGTTCKCAYIEDKHKIELEGFPYDEIVSFGPDFEKEDFEDKDWRPWIKHCLEILATRYTEVNGETYVESLWRTLIGNFDGTTQPAPANTAACFKRYIQLCTIIYLNKKFKFNEQPYTAWHDWSCFDELRDSDTRFKDTIPSVTELREFAEEWHSIVVEEQTWRAANPGAISTNQRQFDLKKMSGPSEIYDLAMGRFRPNRRFFGSNLGWMGLAPKSAVRGDQIWFLSGGKTPFVLRPDAQSRTNVFKLVGECYLHGLMDNEIRGKVSEPAFRRINLS